MSSRPQSPARRFGTPNMRMIIAWLAFSTSGIAWACQPSPSLFSCASVRTIPLKECEALVALYRHTRGEAWHHREGWLRDSDPCRWHGVACGGGHVRQLDLSANGLRGPLPYEIGQLDSLWVLRLSQNHLWGPIPETIRQLSQLRELDLSDNALSGPIPEALGDLRELRWLNLARNQLRGPIPSRLVQLSNLRSVDLSQNPLEGELPADLLRLPSLVIVDLRGTSVCIPKDRMPPVSPMTDWKVAICHSSRR